MTFQELLDGLTTNQAKAWEATEEKWIFCTDILDASDFRRNDYSVNMIESRFEDMLKA